MKQIKGIVNVKEIMNVETMVEQKRTHTYDNEKDKAPRVTTGVSFGNCQLSNHVLSFIFILKFFYDSYL